MNNQMFEKIGRWTIDHLPQILSGFAIAGTVGSVVLTTQATVKAVKAVEKAEEEKQEPLTKTEVVKECWKYYVPTAVTLGCAIGCTIGSQHENTKRNAAIAGLYAMSEATIEEIKKQTREVVGEKKAAEIEKKVDEARLEKTSDPTSPQMVEVEYTGHGMARFEDGFGRRFYSSTNWIDNCVNKLNENMLNGEEYCNWNDLLYELGLHTSEFGDYIGWNRHTDGLIKAKYTAVLEQDGSPTLVVSFNMAPHSNYTRWDALIDR